MIVAVVISVGLFCILRILSNYFTGHKGHVDHWYWKNYIETYRKTRQFPPVLPEYILEKGQWYPPLFPIVLSKFSDVLMDKYQMYAAVLLDFSRLLLLLMVTAQVTGSSDAVIIAGIVYAITPILTFYNTQLNPRGMGALFLDGLIVLLLWIFLNDGSPWLWIGVILLSGLILLVHKMTTQLFWFLCFSVGVFTGEWRLLALIPCSILAAMLLSRGFYWKVLRAHWDIVTFWYRNWRWLNVNPLKASPIYGDVDYREGAFHVPGWKGIKLKSMHLISVNPGAWILAAIALIVVSDGGVQSESMVEWVAGWMILNMIFVLATAFVPVFYCIGAASLYLYNIAFPCALLFALFVYESSEYDSWFEIGFVISLVLSLIVIILKFRQLNEHSPDRDYLPDLYSYLKMQEKGVVMCYPHQLYEPVAYITRFPVLWGGHGFGFRQLEFLHPRLMLPIGEVMMRYHIRYLLVDLDFIPDSFLQDIKGESFRDFGSYRLYLLPSVID